MRIAISGMRGSLGRILYERLSDEGHSVVGLTRRAHLNGRSGGTRTTPIKHPAFKALKMWTF